MEEEGDNKVENIPSLQNHTKKIIILIKISILIPENCYSENR